MNGLPPPHDAHPPTDEAVAAEWLTVEEVATALRLPLSTTYRLVRLGQIRSIKLGHHRRIRREWLEQLGRPDVPAGGAQDLGGVSWNAAPPPSGRKGDRTCGDRSASAARRGAR